ncbi:hypothetical protein CON65_05635 [Bacillus pseudomycoides]|uniref:RDD domain-containing protein n=1 Tax=Bacillus pseudomycoides TaxID=64104 RepID=A0AA91ZUP6_9BACI|nr:hypothetical protein COO03_00805 [Bacillus sp. AFS098217]PED83592.1 hypothetical protein CON65_05635 [Bacillus pseudomycoides]PEU12037.1 hypothetical protein CN524_13675 [Bacillus sp. AFS019443]PEU20232.1 hypothetical protein CN525_04870 [Bacillus sp. AFS014408]PFW63906.1 hypothetical protein COL20_07025 [Bacillus sp. AFS075034]
MKSYAHPYELFVIACTVFIYFIVIPYFTNGKTLGKAILRIQIQGKNKRITFKELFVRYGLFYFGLGGINYILSSSFILNSTNQLVLIVTGLFTFTINAIFIIHVLLHIFSRDKLLFYEHMSRTRNGITLKKAEK